VVGVCAAGCGSSSKSTTAAKTPTVPAITKAEFVAKANVICGKADPLLSAANAKLASQPPEAEIAAVVKGTYVPSIEAQITGIRALGAPAGERGVVTQMLDMVQADLGKVESHPALVATDVFGNFARVAHPYGLTSCAPTS
jgi:hypothetical protein